MNLPQHNAPDTATLEKTLPSTHYHDPAIWTREKERIFAREWVCAGRAEQLPDTGSRLLVDIAGESILLTRAADGRVHGFYNVCRHRGAQLCHGSGGGNANLIRCPYHSWAYGLDGRLIAAPHMKEGEDFRKADFSLYPVGVELWGGFIFIHLTPAEAKPIAEQFGGMPERVRNYPLSRLRIGRTLTYDVAANWKILAENYNECYHCAGVHPELCELVPAFRERGGSELDWSRGIPHRDGAYTFTRSGTTNRAPFPGLDADEQIRHKGELAYPNLFISLACDHVAAFILFPKGPDRTEIQVHFLFAPDEMEKPDFTPEDTVDFWDMVNRQDWAICESVQRGTGSRVHAHGYYAPMEDWNLDIRRYVADRIGD
ncbi:aromatic ring-hydroxylating oxygenase subunit alpha [Niveispirillum sp. KHB5.9]|uniref:aromatic ring-hydroxylating oxygenase subunit alpha n=1 Tax=Niveispirillum sp. KHB5.9 TaxID=3400269 RepID=UPI003A8659C0